MTDAPEDRKAFFARIASGDDYVADHPAVAEAILRAMALANQYEASVIAGDDGAEAVLRSLLGSVGEGVWVKPPLRVDYGFNIHIGKGTSVNASLTALDVASIVIGSDCAIGPNVQLLTPTHPLDPEKRRAKVESAQPIRIGDNVWIGGGAIICPGVTIGDDAVVGAGSVVTKDVPAGAVVAGSPARHLRWVSDNYGN